MSASIRSVDNVDVTFDPFVVGVVILHGQLNPNIFLGIGILPILVEIEDVMENFFRHVEVFNQGANTAFEVIVLFNIFKFIKELEINACHQVGTIFDDLNHLLVAIFCCRKKAGINRKLNQSATIIGNKGA
ncbi:hypothetical protein SDC9_96463 [bioreactor metagenome]|uniref:Uncharacterized protein n=1 Tax=bioreactor metagenome TaxID=1076179 RepID=A0A645A9C6_9ZZZZ